MNSSRPLAFDEQDDDTDFSEFWTLAELANEEFVLPNDIVPNLISRNLNMIQGESSSGKSIIATELATAYATGTKFLGKFDVNVNPDRPSVCYIDQDTFDIERVRDRFLDFRCNPSNLSIPKFWFRLDDEKSVTKMIRYLNHYKVGLLILDSIHAFHKLRDRRNLEHLREGFREIISYGTAVVILSHITKGSSASDIDAARGFGLVEATDYTHGVHREASGKICISNVKSRYGAKTLPFLVEYGGKSRPTEQPNTSLKELVLQHLMDVGDKGTTQSAIRKCVRGDDHAISELLKSSPEIYCDGKRGPGSHIWHVNFRPVTDADVCNDSNENDDESDVETLSDNRCSYTEFGECDSDYEFPV
jgi:hypothetical protein